VGNQGREKKETVIHREQDWADRSRHDNKTTSGEREKEKYRRKTGDRAHICQEVLESVVCDILDGMVLYMRERGGGD